MNLVSQNPFRVIGVLANTSEKELLKQKNRFSAFARAGKIPSSELDFNFLSPLIRDNDTIRDAFSAIELAEDKIFHALFWFTNGNATDEIVIDNFKISNNVKAVEILEKFTKDKALTARNITYFNNLSSYHLANNAVFKGLWVKFQILESEYFTEFVQEIADKTAHINQEKMIDRVITHFIHDIKTVKEPLTKFGLPNGYVRKALSQKLTGEDIAYIEKRISEVNGEDSENAITIYSVAKNLFTTSQEKLVSIVQVLGSDNLQYQLLSDKVAETLRSLSIKIYNNTSEDKNVLPKCQSILEDAYTLATQNQTIRKIEEDQNTLKEKENEENSRIYAEQVVEELNKLDHCALYPAIKYIKNTVTIASNLKRKTGNTEIYQAICNAITIRSLNFCVEKVNEAQEDFSRRASNGNQRQGLDNLLSHVEWSLQIMNTISSLEKSSEINMRYTRDEKQLLDMKKELMAIKGNINPTPSINNTSRTQTTNNASRAQKNDYKNNPGCLSSIFSMIVNLFGYLIALWILGKILSLIFK